MIAFSLAETALFWATIAVIDALSWRGLSAALVVYALSLGLPALGTATIARQRGFRVAATLGLAAATCLGVILGVIAVWIGSPGELEMSVVL